MTDKPKTLLNSFSMPKWIVIQLVEKCNLRCKMCYEWGKEGSYHGKDTLATLDLDVVKKIIADSSPGQPYYGLFGGEPMMYPWIDEVLETIKYYGCGADMPTNGTLLEKHAEMLVETKPRRLWISLDGPEEINDEQRGKGVFQKVKSGIDKLFEVRESKGSQFPKIGITIIVTPLNHMHIEKFFLECVDMSKIDHISIEFQLYATKKQCDDYASVLRNEFGIPDAQGAKGMIWDSSEFDCIDIPKLLAQIKNVEAYCKEKNIYFIAYPKTIEYDNIKNFYTENWDKMADKRGRCAFPWAYAEVNARGNVSSCHTFYDLTHGNVYEKGIIEIWNSPEYDKFRKYVRKNLFPICTACSRYYSDPNKK